MPIYEYKCNICGANFEVRRSFQDEEKEVKCPVCKTRETQRVFSSFSSGSPGSSCAPPSSGSSFG